MRYNMAYQYIWGWKMPTDTRLSLFNQSLEKGLAILKAFNAKRRHMSLSEIADFADMNKSSVQRMIFTLEQLGYVKKHTSSRGYKLTPKVLELGFSYLDSHPLIEIANPFLAELTRLTGETSCLTEPIEDEMIYISRFVSSSFVPVHMPIGSRVPMFCTASGRAYLSALEPSKAAAIIQATNKVALTQYTVTDPDKILAGLEKIRQQGYAVNSEEMILGDMTIAAPILNSSGYPVAVVHIVSPTSRWKKEDAEKQLTPSLMQCVLALRNAARHLE